MSKALIVPGAFQTVKNYGDYEGLDIWLRSFSFKGFPEADYYIGDSGGARFILEHLDLLSNKKFIFINPEIRKVNFIMALWRFLRIFFSEGVPRGKVTPIIEWFHGLKMVKELLGVDVISIMSRIHRENLVIIRGKNDKFFCDEQSVEILKNKNFRVIEVVAGHGWNEKIAQAVEALMKSDREVN